MLKIVVHELITNTAETICDKEGGIFTFFQEKQLEKLQLLFEVFKYDQTTFSHIRSKMTPYITDRGSRIVSDDELMKEPILFTQKLLELWMEIETMIQVSFGGEKMFFTARDYCFKEFMNSQICIATYLAIFVDNEMTKSLKGISN